jgi:hypothetical protein
MLATSSTCRPKPGSFGPIETWAVTATGLRLSFWLRATKAMALPKHAA